jgi:hypothetical protein
MSEPKPSTETKTVRSANTWLRPSETPIRRRGRGTDACREKLSGCLDILGDHIGQDSAGSDIERVNRTLDEIACAIRLDRSFSEDCDQGWFLERLTRIYARGCDQRDNPAFMITATGYASLVAAMSRAFPDLDYGAALGQLIELMTRLFAAQDSGWSVVYGHLRSIPDAVDAKRKLDVVCSADVREWFDAGVQNLFSLQEDLAKKIQDLDAQIEGIDNEIKATRQSMKRARRRLDPAGEGKIVAFQGGIARREIMALQEKRREIAEERNGREETLLLVESDIREFESRLRDARRAYYLELV